LARGGGKKETKGDIKGLGKGRKESSLGEEETGTKAPSKGYRQIWGGRPRNGTREEGKRREEKKSRVKEGLYDRGGTKTRGESTTEGKSPAISGVTKNPIEKSGGGRR